MGESNPHVTSNEIMHVCLKIHLANRPELRVFSNMNLDYPGPPSPAGSPSPYVSPDIMVVKPSRPLGEDVPSYFLGKDGPAPLQVTEILSERSAQQQDLGKKPILYARLGVAEYILIDVSGEFLPQRLLLKRLQSDGSWKDEQDADGGITSQLGFRVIIDADGQLRLIDAATGKRYARPDEAEKEAEARRTAEKRAQREARARRKAQEQAQREMDERRNAEERIRALEAELARLRGTKGDPPTA
jgi:hypothetical protein